MSLHLGARLLGFLLRTSDDSSRDDEIAFLGGTGAPSGSTYGGKVMPATQVAVALRQDGTVDQLLNVTVDGGTNWETFLTAAYYASTAGAGAIGILDTAGYYTLTQTEGALTEIGTQIGGLTSTTYTFTEQNVLANDDFLYPALEKLDLQWGDLAGIGAGEGVTNIGLTTGSMMVGVANTGAELDVGGTAQGIAFGDGAGVVATGTIQDVATGVTAASADTASSTATVTEDHVVPQSELYFNMAAAGTNIVAQMASDVDESTWANITQSPDLRTIQIDASALWDGGDIGVTALWSDGTLEEKTLTATAGSVVQSAYGVVPASISRVRNLGTFSAGTVDVQTGRYPAIQTGSRVPTLVAFIEESTNGYDGAATIDANGVITNTDAPNGALDFRAFYTLANALTDAGHVHVSGAITVTDPTHGHTVA